MPSTLPRGENLHVAVIMDGNGRWATRRGLPRPAGHRAGVAALRRIIAAAPALGIATLSVFAFSGDNWQRPAAEVDALMWLMRAYLRAATKELVEAGVRLCVIGRRDRMPGPLIDEIARGEAATAGGDRLHLRIALDYSSREAIACAAVRCATSLPPSLDLVGRLIADSLADDSTVGEVDLLIRTGGEKRLSDFLLWECAYAELWFSDVMWPDFDAEALRGAIADFHRRERRFGGLPPGALALGAAE
jgi:undecaprenyl diphosphate synthase